MKRSCRKCGKQIPNLVKIEGKTHSLQNRKFCLKCSPFKKHNTKADVDTISWTRKKYKEHPEEWKQKYILKLQERAKSRKAALISAMGGGCKYCGYNRCIRALSFHHLDPKIKKFGLSANNLWAKSMDDIKQEAAKCELVCLRCHAEIEEGLVPNQL